MKEENTSNEVLEEKLELLRAWGEFYGEILLNYRFCKKMLTRIFVILEKGEELKLEVILIENFLMKIKEKLGKKMVSKEFFEENIKKKEVIFIETIPSTPKTPKTPYTIIKIIIKRILNWENSIENKKVKPDEESQIKALTILFKLPELEEFYYVFPEKVIRIYEDEKHILDIMRKLTNLKKLALTYYGEEFGSLAKLCNLQVLWISTKGKTIEEIENLHKLEILFINSDCDYLPNNLFKLSNLKSLAVNKCKNKVLPDDFINLKNLEKLSLFDFKFSIIPEVIIQLSNLKELSITLDNVESLPNEIGCLEKLEYLYIRGVSNCKNIDKLKNLKKLEIRNAYINMDFSINLSELKLLESLEIVCKMKEFPVTINNIVNLKELTLFDHSENKFHLPESLKNLKLLEKLKIHNKIDCEEIPIVITEFKNLRELDLSFKSENLVFPKEMEKLEKLEKLTIKRSNITEIPEVICSLPSLKILYLGGNKIEKIPDSIVKLTKLEILDLNGNNISYLPSVIGELKNLRILNLISNYIIKIPYEIHQLESLEEFLISTIAYDENDYPEKIRISENLAFAKNLKLLYIHNVLRENFFKTIKQLVFNSNNAVISVNDVHLTKSLIDLYEKKSNGKRNTLKDLAIPSMTDSDELYEMKFEHFLDYLIDVYIRLTKY